MTTGPNGENLTMAARLSDIASRYGETSTQYINAYKIAEKLKRIFPEN